MHVHSNEPKVLEQFAKAWQLCNCSEPYAWYLFPAVEDIRNKYFLKMQIGRRIMAGEAPSNTLIDVTAFRKEGIEDGGVLESGRI